MITLAYSFVLKRQPLLDVVVLAGLFTLRVLAGSLLLPTPVSPWLLTFSMLFFLGLAMIKRYAELDRVIKAGGGGIAARGYTARDLPLLLAAGIASGFGAVVIFTIYLINDHYPREHLRQPRPALGDDAGDPDLDPAHVAPDRARAHGRGPGRLRPEGPRLAGARRPAWA